MNETKMSGPTGPAGLVRKLAAVAAAVGRIPKNGVNAAQSYKYVQDADVMEAIRAELSSRHVLITPKVTRLEWRQIQGGQKAINVATVHMTFTAWDGETGDSLEVAQTVGEGMDYGDKNVPKAITGATKSAMLKLFFIPTGDDPEASAELDKDATATAPRAQAATARQSTPAPARAAPPQRQPAPSSGPLPDSFPNFGSKSGQPLAGAQERDLKWYAGVLKKNVHDPAKARFKDENATYLKAIERALESGNRRGPTDALEEPPPPGDDDAPY